MKVDFLKAAKGTISKITEPYYASGAAELAFWLLLSLAPATILLAQFLRIFTLSMEAANNVLRTYLSEEVFEIISPLLGYHPRSGVTVFLVVVALWAGSSAVFTLIRITNRTYGIFPKTGSQIAWAITERLRSILMTILILVTIVFALYIVVYGELLVRTVLSYNNVFLGREYTFSEVWFGVRWIIAFVLFFVMSYSIYFILPRTVFTEKDETGTRERFSAKDLFAGFMRNRRKESIGVLPGSIFAAVAMLIATWIYTLYVTSASFENFNILYGGLSSIVALLIWFYIISYIVIVGIQVNAVNAELEAMEKDGD